MSYFYRYLKAVLSSGLITGLILASELHPFAALILVLLAILPALFIPRLLLDLSSKPEGVRL